MAQRIPRDESLSRVHGVGALFAAAYGNVGSSIYYALGVTAAFALGLTYSQTMRYVVLPQAFRNMLPVLLTQTIVLFQDTSLVYVLSITDFLGAASKIAQRDGRLVEMYLFAALVYFVISFVASLLARRLQRRVAVIR